MRTDLLTPAELARELGVTTRTLARWQKQGHAPARIQIQRQIFYRRETVEAWLAGSEQLVGGGRS